MVKSQSFLELENFVFEEITERLAPKYTYHTVSHISMVLRDSTYLCKKLNLSHNEIRLVQTAACMHDYGFIYNHLEHEARSCKEAQEILPNYGYTAEEIEVICEMIMATKIPQSPKTLLEKVLCDADLFYLGSDYYFEIASRFKRELQHLGLLKSEKHWREIQVDFLENHHFHLPLSKQLLDPIKAKNLSILKCSE